MRVRKLSATFLLQQRLAQAETARTAQQAAAVNDDVDEDDNVTSCDGPVYNERTTNYGKEGGTKASVRPCVGQSVSAAPD